MTEVAPPPYIRPRKGIPLVWALPLLTLLVGLWLLWQGVVDRGQRFTIEFESGEGIVAGQTELRYKGISIGIVQSLQAKQDLSGVEATVELERSVKRDFLTADSQFWLVQPQVTASGISGLGALMTGNYIAVQPGRDTDTRDHFIALRSAPPLPTSEPGLHLNLRSDRVGSLTPGTPVLYRQINIGSVQSYQMAPDGQGVIIRIHIQPEYAHLVRENSRFWNASGLRLEAGIGGMKLRTESLATLLAGGIALGPVDDKAPAASNGRQFPLYADYEEAEVGLQIRIRFPSGDGLSPGTKVMYKGFAAGRVRNVWFDREAGDAVAEVGLKPQMESLINEYTRFWQVAPTISLAGVSGLDALISGSYISFESVPGGKPKREFIAASGPAPANYATPGLHIRLEADETRGLQPGAQVYHRQIAVGSVEDIALAKEGKGVQIQVLVRPEYAHLVNQGSRFWNTSGLKVDAGLGGLQLRTDSLASVLAGGIAFDSDGDAPAVGNGHRFRLHPDPDSARGSLRATLWLPSAEGLVEGRTRLIHRGLTLGTVERIELDAKGERVKATLALRGEAEPLLVDGTQFWLVRPAIGPAGATGLDALLGGPYLALSPGSSGKPSREFNLRPAPAPLPDSAPGLHLLLQGAEAGSLAQGAPVLYRKLEVGSVQEVRHSGDGRQVQVRIHIRPEHARLVSRNSRFWNASGITVSGGLGGLRLHSESAGALLAGGVAFSNPEPPAGSAAAGASPRNGDRFTLYPGEIEAENAGLTLRLSASHSHNLQLNAPLRYRGLQVGQVTRLGLSSDLGRVEAEATLRPEAAALARAGSHFWLAQPRLGLARSEHVGAVFSGPEIHIQAGEGAPRREFPLEEEAPATTRADTGLNLVLEAAQLGSLRAGDPVTFRQVRVGQVLGTGLSGDGTRALAYINIAPEHARLVRQGSRFWLTSGVSIKAGLGGIEMRTESAETILSGGVAFASPGGSGAARAGQSFELVDAPRREWLEWRAELPAR